MFAIFAKFIPFTLLIILLSFNSLANTELKKLSFSVLKTAESSGSLEAMVVAGGDFFTVRQLVHTAVLVRHPKGDFLWDSGIGREVEQQMQDFNFLEKQLFSIENINPAAQQLLDGGYSLDSLMAIIPSHMHWDHASGIEDFASVPVWIQKHSLEEAREGMPPGFLQSQYDSGDIIWRLIELNAVAYKGFDKSLDIFGDNSAVLVDLSGHTHGQLGLFLNNIGEGESYFFIGDTTWALKGVIDNMPRPGVVEWFVGVDTDFEQNSSVIAKIHALKLEDPTLHIVPAHDELVLETMPVYPNFKE